MTSVSSWEQGDGSLSDSWATLSSTDARSEDDASTASLIVRSRADDVVSLEGHEDGSESEAESHSSEAMSFTFPIPSSKYQDDGTPSASFMSTASDSIVFDEPEDWPGTETVVLKRTINVYDEQVNPEALDHLPFEVKDGHVVVSVQQTIARHTLNVNRPFRVLYIGDSKLRSNVLDKIGDVLVTSPCNSFYNGDPSRFHVVPTSYGPDATPNFAELLPIHVQLVVDECISATATAAKEDHHPDTIKLSFKDRDDCTSRWTGIDFELSTSALPDVAIFVLGDNDTDHVRTTRHLAHTFMTRYAVPSMVISESPLWTKGDPMAPFNFHGLHVCLESRDPTTGDLKILGRFPVDLKTFENIAPGQLNRNLASLITASRSAFSVPELDSKPKPKHAMKAADIEKYAVTQPGDEDLSDLKRHPVRRFQDPTPLLISILMPLICVMALWYGYTGIKLMFMFMFQYSTKFFGMVPAWQGNETSSSLGTQFGPGTTAIRPVEVFPASMPTKDLSCAVESLLDINEYILELSRPADTEKAIEDLQKFQVHVVGDCHAIIRLPPNMPTGRRSPKFDVKITRSGIELPFEASKLFDGVYTVRLAREDAYGPITVEITTKSKSISDQVIDIDFGTPWLKVSSWKRSARHLSSQLQKELNVAQTELSEVYNRVSLDLGDAFRHEVDSGTRLIKAAGGMMSRSKRVSDQLKQEAEDCFANSLSQIRKLLLNVRRDTQCFADKARMATDTKFARFRHFARAQSRLAKMNLKQRLDSWFNFGRPLASAQKQAQILARDGRGWRRFLTADVR